MTSQQSVNQTVKLILIFSVLEVCWGVKSFTIVTDCSVNVYNRTVLIKLYTKQETQNEDQTNGCNRPLVTCRKSQVDKESSSEMDSGDVCWWEGAITAQPSRSPGPVRAASTKESLSTKSQHSSSLEVLSFQPAKSLSSGRHSFWHKNKFCLTSKQAMQGSVCVRET